MAKRFAAIWLPYLATDSMAIRQPALQDLPFVLSAPQRGRMVVHAASRAAAHEGIAPGMVVADARAVLPQVAVFPYEGTAAAKLLEALARWSLCYTPVAATDPPDGLILDISGCAHLWGGERRYLTHITHRIGSRGYSVRAAIADTAGTAWALARYGQDGSIVAPGTQAAALRPLPPVALRLDTAVLQRMHKLGFRNIGQFIDIPPSTLRRRFGDTLLTRLQQALGTAPEPIEPVQPAIPYQERLPSLEPIRTATGIGIALQRLLEALCLRLSREGKGLRKAVLKGYCIDGHIREIEIGTNKPSRNVTHLFRLFELKIPTIEPGLGIELFLLEAPLVEDVCETQESLWHAVGDDAAIAELLDSIAGKTGTAAIRRYLPQEHHWPERSVKAVSSLAVQPETDWRTDKPRPLLLLREPELIEVMVPLPDYPPVMFCYQGKVHHIKKADGPERIEQEWWIAEGQPRDYYHVEDESGARYWLFRLGLYANSDPQWFLHGFFA